MLLKPLKLCWSELIKWRFEFETRKLLSNCSFFDVNMVWPSSKLFTTQCLDLLISYKPRPSIRVCTRVDLSQHPSWVKSNLNSFLEHLKSNSSRVINQIRFFISFFYLRLFLCYLSFTEFLVMLYNSVVGVCVLGRETRWTGLLW